MPLIAPLKVTASLRSKAKVPLSVTFPVMLPLVPPLPIWSVPALIVVTPEYNHGPSAVLKNALDYAYKEFNRKPIGFVGYGGVGAARAVEQLRLIAIELQMAPVAHAVHVGMVECLGIMQQGKTFEDFPHLAQAANRLLDEMSWWAKVLKPARESMTTGVAA